VATVGASVVEFAGGRREAVRADYFKEPAFMLLYLAAVTTVFGIAIAALELAGPAHAGVDNGATCDTASVEIAWNRSLA
jgi:hypothetical protein